MDGGSGGYLDGMTDPAAPSPSSPPLLQRLGRWPHVAFAAVAGVLHGLLARLTFGLPELKDVLGIMTGSFLFLVPLSMGAVSVLIMRREQKIGWIGRLLGAIVPAWIALFCSLLLAWEGLICIFLWVPLYTVMALVGALCAELVDTLITRSRGRNAALFGFMALPYAMAPVESLLPHPEQIRTVENTIDIAASPAVVWDHIKRVERFEPDEHHFAWTHMIGFPRPVEATLSHEGVGGVRHASFEGDVVFVETITRWEPQHMLTFGIDIDADAIPATTLDQHVTIGGPYFDVLEGEYELEPLPDGSVRLHLRSRHRVSTRFNPYATLWTDFIMSDVQSYILTILKRRCEA